MVDAIVSAASERLIALLEEQARYHINLVKGAEDNIRSLAQDLQDTRNVLDDAENRRFKDRNINYWLSRLEQTAYEMEDVLDEWDYALLKFQMEEEAIVAPKVCSFIPSCLCFNKVAVRHNIGKKILIVEAKLDDILKRRDKYGFVISQPNSHPLPESWRVQSTSMVDLAEVHGRDKDVDELVTKLIDSGGSQEESGFHILSIVGIGGLGKTTLAQMVYNHSRVEESFELRIWICVSNPFDLAAIAKGIIESIKDERPPNSNQLDVLFKHVQKSISGKKFLLVLDDVWTQDYNKWEPLKNSLRCGGVGSKILVTSRSERVVKMMGSRESEICRPGLLSDDDCWLLLCRMSLSERNEAEFEDIGKEIAKKCKGLPLAVKTLASLLRFKSSLEGWSNVSNSDIWQMEEVEVEMFPHLLLSYNELSPAVKRCFSYCAFFPKDAQIVVESLIQAWMALGYLGSNVGDMELKGREYFDALAMRSLFQDFEKGDLGEIKRCKMHDIVHDFAQFLKKRSTGEPKRMKKDTACRVCDPSHVSIVNEFFTLACTREGLPNLCDCLIRLRVLRVECCTIIPQGMEKLIHLRKLALIGITKLSSEDLKVVFHLYHLQSLSLIRCGIEEIPKEIGNLIHLRFLNLRDNELKELPMEIGNLIHLRHLDLSLDKYLEELPESICDLQQLQTLNNEGCDSLCRIPERVVEKLSEFPGGIGGSKLESWKKLKKNVRGRVRLGFRLDGDGDLNEMVQDVWKAQLKNEIHITNLEIYFKVDEMQQGEEWVWMDLLDALQPHPNLTQLVIENFGGSKLPRWIVSPLNEVRDLSLMNCKHLTSLPPLGKLQCLENIFIMNMEALEVVGREFLGITRVEGEGGVVTAFPKLKTLTVWECSKWKGWEDITVQEEEEESASIMPCLTNLTIGLCESLRMLPHRLLCKVSSLKTLDISGSKELQQRYEDKDGSDWKSISINNPCLRLISNTYE